MQNNDDERSPNGHRMKQIYCENRTDVPDVLITFHILLFFSSLGPIRYRFSQKKNLKKKNPIQRGHLSSRKI